ncbi:MAG: S41 family peptidase [Kiritimatiellales bacterium]
MQRWIFILIACAGVAIAAPDKGSYTNAYDAITLFTKVLEQVHRGYVEPEEAGYDQLIRHALAGMLQNLDPYSQFLDEESYRDLKNDTSGHFGGVGLVIGKKEGMLTVVSPMEDTPAFRAGILSGDVIVEIDGTETHRLSLADAVKKMRGEPGTDVALKISRSFGRDIKEYIITREDIKVESVKDAKMIDNNIAYIRITQFNEPSAGKLKEALKALQQEGMRALVLDLRGNPGGLLSSAAGVTELFLPRGELIVFTRGAENDKPPQRYLSAGSTHYTEIPLAILVNGGSASASEIVAGALQDHQRAILVGERTFGKGSVQTILPLDDGAAVKLTTAKYYTPSERVIHENGIEPDITVEMNPEVLYNIRLRQMQLESDVEDGKVIAEQIDIQLEKAVGVLQGVLIFQKK